MWIKTVDGDLVNVDHVVQFTITTDIKSGTTRQESKYHYAVVAYVNGLAQAKYLTRHYDDRAKLIKAMDWIKYEIVTGVKIIEMGAYDGKVRKEDNQQSQ